MWPQGGGVGMDYPEIYLTLPGAVRPKFMGETEPNYAGKYKIEALIYHGDGREFFLQLKYDGSNKRKRLGKAGIRMPLRTLEKMLGALAKQSEDAEQAESEKARKRSVDRERRRAR
jgi:hypothetical protein